MGKYYSAAADSNAFSADKPNINIFSRAICVTRRIADTGRVAVTDICIPGFKPGRERAGNFDTYTGEFILRDTDSLSDSGCCR